MTELSLSVTRTTVTVTGGTTLTIATPATTVSIATPGTTGPAGPPGASGAGFNFTQSAPAATWTINHNLGLRPCVELFDAGGNQLIGEVVHVSTNQCIAYFAVAIEGSARLA